MNLRPELALKLYGDMCRVRAFELGLEREFKRGNVPGMLHTGLGQEATQAAIAANLRHTDCFFPDHRCHGLLMLAGTPGERIMAELFGRSTGICSGKGGSLHSADRSVGNFGNNAVEGSMMVTALGAALGYKLQRTDRVAAVIVGDGTSGRGEWHESMNLASTWKAPVLYCCVNNGYAISTPSRSAMPPATSASLRPRTASPRSRWTATTSRRHTGPPRKRSRTSARARDPTSWSTRPGAGRGCSAASSARPTR